MSKKVAVVVGVGPGNGAACARALSEAGYAVAVMARKSEFIGEHAGELDGAVAQTCDVTDPDAIVIAFNAVKEQLGPVDVLVYNAGSGLFADFEKAEAGDMERAWQINCLGLFRCGKAVVDDMVERGTGAIVVTGATASLRGGANFTAFASAKAAQRSLAQSMARHLGPKGVHVALVIVDGIIDLPRTRERFPDVPEDKMLQPDDIAHAVRFLAEQPKSAWTFELDVRPSTENW